MAQRSWLIDGLKVGASQLIVLHHLARYAPMAELVAPDWPRLSAWLADEARYVVQLFLVVGGFLAAQGLAQREHGLMRLLLQRAVRLVPMLAVALLAVLLASAWLPAGRWPDWVSPWPSAGVLAAHLLLLQDVLGIDSLSAGAWYVAIDLQCYALLAAGAVLLHRHPERPLWQSPLPWAVAALTLASIAWFNRNAAFEAWAPYFFGAYGLGALAAWARRSRALALLFTLVCVVQLALAWFEPRPRGVAACLTAAALLTLASRRATIGGCTRWLADAADACYGVFVIHYAVIVAATALWLRLDLRSVPAAYGLLLLAWAASLAAGAALHQRVGVPLSRVPWARLPRVGAT
jgi:peptidoglycan/LPS O-acetylase OafA/YrhL